MIHKVSPELLILLLVPLLTVVITRLRLFSDRSRHVFGILSCLATICFFSALLQSLEFEGTIQIIPLLFQLSHLSVHSGILFSFVYLLVYIAFGKRIFVTQSASSWVLIQLLVSLALISDSTLVFMLILVTALLTHLSVSQVDVYQVSKRQDRFILVTFFTVAAIIISALFFGALYFSLGIDCFSVLYQSVGLMSRPLKILSSVFMMIFLGAFPLHFWVKPLFAAPARYGLAVITRLNIGFVVWCKLYPLIFSGDVLLDSLLTYGCGANLLYAAFLLFGERKLSQIVSCLYLFHVPLLILAVKVSGTEGASGFALDFANITIAIGGLLIILGMLRDRLGAENLDHASGLAISYPFLGIAFLICILSLVGFPGTLGFICSEIVLHHFAESTWPVAVAFIITLALNGYSSFRIFGESFYGDPAQSYRKTFQPLRREKIALVMLLVFLFFSGIGPQFVNSASIPAPVSVSGITTDSSP